MHETIGAVLLEIDMPGLDGPGTLQLLQQIDPKVRVVFMGDSQQYDGEHLLALGALDVLGKPFASVKHVADLLHRAAADKR